MNLIAAWSAILLGLVSGLVMGLFFHRENWLGGFMRAGKPVRTLATLQEILSPDFELSGTRDLPFLIREHARKFQLGIAEASVWRRR